MCTFGLSKRAHFRAPALQTPPKFHERTPRERKKNENCGGRREKKARNFGPPTLRGSTLLGSTLRGPTLRGPTLRGPTFSRFGASTLWALHSSGPHTLSSQNSTSKKNWPKSNRPRSKLAEVEIGRSRSRSPCRLRPRQQIGTVTISRREVGILGILHGLKIRDFFSEFRTSFGCREINFPTIQRV